MKKEHCWLSIYETKNKHSSQESQVFREIVRTGHIFLNKNFEYENLNQIKEVKRMYEWIPSFLD